MTRRIDAPDTDADIELREILNQTSKTGFLMIAGAGSGKTTSLVKALAYVVEAHGPQLLAKTQKVACITYTEVAATEIARDLENSPLAEIATIHSFLWSLAKPFQKDIGTWLRARVQEKIEEQATALAAAKTQSKRDTSAANLERARHQLQQLDTIDRYNYSIGPDYGRGILGHEDILKMVPSLIESKLLLSKIAARKYPFIFVDESQDTFSGVVDCLKVIYRQADSQFCLGFFGDPMQQIFQRSTGRIEKEPGWKEVKKPENFRSSRRVLEVVNRVREPGDGLQQVSGLGEEHQVEGETFFFVLPVDDNRTTNLEKVRSWLSANSKAGEWTSDNTSVGAKILMITHRMAARRMGFDDLYSAFHYKNSPSGLKSAFDEGTAWPLRIFERVILPLCDVSSADDPSVIHVLRDQDGSLSSGKVERNVRERLRETRAAVNTLRDLMAAGGPGSVEAVLRHVAASTAIDLEPRLSAYLDPDGQYSDVVLYDEVRALMDRLMLCDVRQVSGYFEYIREESPYSTQHGTKGSEFRKVIVVLDDDEGNYNLYSYDKLFGLRGLSATDQERQSAGEDSVLERTRRLLYVCVSRAEESLAVVFFARSIEAAEAALLRSKVAESAQVLKVEDIS